MSLVPMKRRQVVALAATLALIGPGAALAQAKLKVAAIYTVPFEQQWVSRIHKALKAAEARGEGLRVGGTGGIREGGAPREGA